MPTTYLMVLLLLSIGLHFIFTIKKVIHSPYIFFGVIFIVFGSILNIWADNLFKKSETTVRPDESPTSMEVTGPFRISRHPMYLGMLSALIGLFILLGSITPLFAVPICVWIMTKKFILIEEKALEEKFGEDYLKYKDKVRRWL